ncbi:MAG: hypothetical protein ACRDFB_05415 [Rhabdochlamydiaceae bacterium]
MIVSTQKIKNPFVRENLKHIVIKEVRSSEKGDFYLAVNGNIYCQPMNRPLQNIRPIIEPEEDYEFITYDGGETYQSMKKEHKIGLLEIDLDMLPKSLSDSFSRESIAQIRITTVGHDIIAVPLAAFRGCRTVYSRLGDLEDSQR